MKRNPFTRSGRPLVSRVASDGNLKKSIEHSVSLIGGFDKLVEKGDTILLKPNYNTADPFPGSSDPEFIKSIIELLYEAGAARVNSRGEDVFPLQPEGFEQAGVIRVAEEAGAEVRVFGKDGWGAVFDRDGWRRVEVKGGRYLRKVSLAK